MAGAQRFSRTTAAFLCDEEAGPFSSVLLLWRITKSQLVELLWFDMGAGAAFQE
jgi:hypothetical protein